MTDFFDNKHVLWIDCEFTGLSLKNDLLIEVGAVVTSGLFNEVDSLAMVVSQPQAAVEERMENDNWWPSRPEHRGQFLIEISESTNTLANIDSAFSALIKRYFEDNVVPAGNSLSLDRQFIARDLPYFNGLLSYRSIDVSSFKEVARYYGVRDYEKAGQHRVLADIRESIRELEYLLHEIGSRAMPNLGSD